MDPSTLVQCRGSTVAIIPFGFQIVTKLNRAPECSIRFPTSEKTPVLQDLLLENEEVEKVNPKA